MGVDLVPYGGAFTIAGVICQKWAEFGGKRRSFFYYERNLSKVDGCLLQGETFTIMGEICQKWEDTRH